MSTTRRDWRDVIGYITFFGSFILFAASRGAHEVLCAWLGAGSLIATVALVLWIIARPLNSPRPE